MNTDATLPRQIIRRWPSRRDLAADLGTDVWAVHRYWQRSRLWPGGRDARALEAAARRGIVLTADELIAARAAPDAGGSS